MKHKDFLDLWLAAATVFTVISIAAMVFFLMNRNTAAETMDLTDAASPDGYEEMEEGIFSENTTGLDGYLCIPLQDGVSDDDITVSSDIYAEKTVIEIHNTSEDFYYKNPLTGSRNHITSLLYEYRDSGARLNIIYDGMYEPSIMNESGSLYLKLETPEEMYGKVVLIDAAHGGDDAGTVAYGVKEKDVTYGVSEKLEALSDSAGDTDAAKFYFTRSSDVNTDSSTRSREAAGLAPDIIISLHTSADPDTRVTRGVKVFYGADGGKQEAEELSGLIAKATGLTDLGAAADTSGDDAAVSSGSRLYLRVGLGYMTNRSEALELESGDYQEAAAKAILDFVDKEAGKN